MIILFKTLFSLLKNFIIFSLQLQFPFNFPFPKHLSNNKNITMKHLIINSDYNQSFNGISPKAVFHFLLLLNGVILIGEVKFNKRSESFYISMIIWNAYIPLRECKGFICCASNTRYHCSLNNTYFFF